ncbi:probable glutathione S-transferase [Ipomoea triloba]|uniref:probable glutathione S-transferase n=1 Tax=Ipomoea triloba TaxID=35885 RepID=UPI00125D6AB3|nr:probable glutathione S-transferase [Ipomoea triloba]
MGSDDDEVVLLSSYVNVFTTRARMALALKGVHYESKEDMENQSPSSLLQEMNPVHKKIPVLIHNGKPICESLIILQYIDEVWNHNSPLLPSDPYNRAQARFWADFIDKKVVLLDKDVSMFAMRPKMALALKGIHYESKEEDLMNKSSLLLEMNPVHKKIPVLIHNGKPVCESLIILEYIDEVWKDKFPLLPSDPYKRAQARFWADFIDTKIYECLKAWVLKTKDAKDIKEELVEKLKVLEGELGEEAYYGGERIGFLDLALLSYYTWLLTFEKDTEFSCMETEIPKLSEWAKRCLQNESVSTSLADPLKIFEFIRR